ncbi:hypothetical protein L1887_54896 [Cichorium endivia]|nr:hypothetical protein L1887_54896 [Cichorium endivia]
MQLGLGIVVDAPSLVTAVAAFPCMDEALFAARHLAAAAFYARHICCFAHIDKSGPPRWQRWNRGEQGREPRPAKASRRTANHATSSPELGARNSDDLTSAWLSAVASRLQLSADPCEQIAFAVDRLCKSDRGPTDGHRAINPHRQQPCAVCTLAPLCRFVVLPPQSEATQKSRQSHGLISQCPLLHEPPGLGSGLGLSARLPYRCRQGCRSGVASA